MPRPPSLPRPGVPICGSLTSAADETTRAAAQRMPVRRLREQIGGDMAISRRRFSTALPALLTLPGLAGRASAQAATIKIGMCAPVTGPAAESGRYAQIGARIAVDAVNKAGGVVGK